MKKFFYAVCLMMLVTTLGCGSKAKIASPADGQTFTIQNFSQLQVTTDTNDYSNLAITFRGATPSSIVCTSTSGSPAYCSLSQSRNTTAGGCTTNCTVVILLTNGDQVLDVRTITFK